MGRLPRSRLDLLRPNLHNKVQQQQERQKANKDNRAPTRSFSVNDTVLVADLPARDTWLPGTVTKVLGSRSYEILLDENRTIRRHIDHIRMNSIPRSSSAEELPTDWVPNPMVDRPTSPSPSLPEYPPADPPPRRSSRSSRPPDRLIDQYTLDCVY